MARASIAFYVASFHVHTGLKTRHSCAAAAPSRDRKRAKDGPRWFDGPVNPSSCHDGPADERVLDKD
jgi:hypothetical protein